MGNIFGESLRSGRVQVVLAVVCAAGVFGGSQLSRSSRASDTADLSAERIEGTWDLQSVGGEAIGPDVQSGVILQHVTFLHGKIQGETRLLATSVAATTAMPFPDLSVAHVEESQDSHEVAVTWKGTYTLLPNNRVEFRIGKAQYKLAAKFNMSPFGLEMEQDTILTYKGATLYRPLSMLAKK